MSDQDVTLGEVFRAVNEVKEQMVTKDAYKAGQDAITQRIDSTEAKISDERVARVQGDADLRAEIKAATERQKVIEDRQENRKYSVNIAVVLAAIGVLLSIFGDVIKTAIAGG